MELVHVIASCDCVQGAIVTMTKALAKDLVKKKGVRVNAVAPGGAAFLRAQTVLQNDKQDKSFIVA